MFSRIFSTSAWICGVVPIGGVATLNLSGFGLGERDELLDGLRRQSDWTTNVFGEVASSQTPTKSFAGS